MVYAYTHNLKQGKVGKDHFLSKKMDKLQLLAASKIDLAFIAVYRLCDNWLDLWISSNPLSPGYSLKTKRLSFCNNIKSGACNCCLLNLSLVLSLICNFSPLQTQSFQLKQIKQGMLNIEKCSQLAHSLINKQYILTVLHTVCGLLTYSCAWMCIQNNS